MGVGVGAWGGKTSLNLIKIIELSALGAYRTVSSRGSQAGGFGWGRCGRVGWRGVGNKASLNLIKIIELSALEPGNRVWGGAGRG